MLDRDRAHGEVGHPKSGWSLHLHVKRVLMAALGAWDALLSARDRAQPTYSGKYVLLASKAATRRSRGPASVNGVRAEPDLPGPNPPVRVGLQQTDACIARDAAPDSPR